MVAVVFNKSPEDILRIVQELKPDIVQLHGEEPEETVAQLKEQVKCEVWKVFHLPAARTVQEADLEVLLERMKKYCASWVDKVLVDASVKAKGVMHYGGTGRTVDWNAARWLRERCPCPFILAGGLNPDNVADAIQEVQPYGIDLSSGVELHLAKGFAKTEAFV